MKSRIPLSIHRLFRLILLTTTLPMVPAALSSANIAFANSCETLEAELYFIDHKHLILPVGPQGPLTKSSKSAEGSQSGTWTKDSAGNYWFLKPDAGAPQLQTAAEVITSSIYRYLGYRASEVTLVEYNGKRYAAVKSLGSKIKTTTLQQGANDKYFRQLRAFAAYLKDWDRLRQGPNNIDLGDGKYALFDFGGTLGARAGGSPKPGLAYSDAIGCYEANTTYGEILGNFRVNWLPDNHPWKETFTIADLKDLARKFSYLTDAAIDLIVDKAAYSNSLDASYMKRALKSRRDAMIAGITAEISVAAKDAGTVNPGNSNHQGLSKPHPTYSNHSVQTFTWTNSKAINQTSSLPDISPFDLSLVKSYVTGDVWHYLPAYLSGWDHYISSEKQKVTFTGEQLQKASATRDMFDRLMSQVEALPVGLKLFRGKGTIRPIEPLQKGEGHTEQVYLPTSIDEVVARAFLDLGISKYPGQPNLKLILTVYQVMTPGVKGLYMPAVFKKAKALSGIAEGEEEVLLDRGLYFRGLGVHTEEYRGRTLWVETVGVFPK